MLVQPSCDTVIDGLAARVCPPALVSVMSDLLLHVTSPEAPVMLGLDCPESIS